MKKLLLGLLAFGSISAFAQNLPEWIKHDSAISLASYRPHIGLVKSVYKGQFKKFTMNVSNDLKNQESFSEISKTILEIEPNRKNVVTKTSIPDFIEASGKDGKYEMTYLSKNTGDELFTLSILCKHNNLPALSEETHGEYVYYAAQDAYTCFVTGVRE